MTPISQFLSEVRAELGRVSWPTRSQLVIYTGVVIGLSLVVALYLGGIDALLGWAVSKIIGQ